MVVSVERTILPADEPDWSRLDWRDTDQITHIDALTPVSYRVLPFTGARRVESRVIPFLLAHLAEMGLASTLELYDHANRCVTILTQAGPICPHLDEAWESITASLPEI